MFSQACVKNSVHGEEGVHSHPLGRHPQQTPPSGQTAASGQTPHADTLHPRQTPQGRHPLGRLPTYPQADTHPMGKHPPPPPRQTATAADGRHPTGTHSCYGIKITTFQANSLEENICGTKGV